MSVESQYQRREEVIMADITALKEKFDLLKGKFEEARDRL